MVILRGDWITDFLWLCFPVFCIFQKSYVYSTPVSIKYNINPEWNIIIKSDGSEGTLYSLLLEILKIKLRSDN